MSPRVNEIRFGLRPQLLSSGEVAHLKFSSGALVCGFVPTSGLGGMVYLPSGCGSDGAQAVTKLIQLLSVREGAFAVKLKIVGDLKERGIAVTVATELGVEVVGEAELGNKSPEIYFIPELGKIRFGSPGVTKPAKKAITKPVNQKARIMIVDDSSTIRKILRQIFESDPKLEVCAETGKPTEAEKLIHQHKPDLITMDIHMPEMDGITLLQRVTAKFPIPVVMISSINFLEGTQILKALEFGAVDYIEKPSNDKFKVLAPEINEKIKAAVASKRRVAIKPNLFPSNLKIDTQTPILIGSSTGGTEALKEVLMALPKDIPPILIVQHIPPVFSEAFAMRLNELCLFEVREAKDGDTVQSGTVLIAPGGKHMTVARSGGVYQVKISDGPDGYRHKPAVDVLFDSATTVYGKNCIGVILTGMGEDGAEGLLKLRKLGSHTIGQDEATCVVYGMPRVAAERGAVEVVLPLHKIPEQLVTWLTQKRAKAA